MGLLELPQELRDEILSYIIEEPRTIDLLRKASLTKRQVKLPQPPISKVCRQLREDWHSMLYGNNIFEIELDSEQVIPTVRKWFESMSINSWSKLRDLRLRRARYIPTRAQVLFVSVRVFPKTRTLELDTYTESLSHDHGINEWKTYGSISEMEALVESLRSGIVDWGGGAGFTVEELEGLMRDFVRSCRKMKV